MPAPAAAASFEPTYATGGDRTAQGALAVWAQLLARIRCTVQECNAAAGEPLWTMFEQQSDPMRLSVCHAGHSSRCLELSLEPAAAALRCIYGCAAGGASLELLAAAGGARIGERRLTVAETAAFLLDPLVAGLD